MDMKLMRIYLYAPNVNHHSIRTSGKPAATRACYKLGAIR